MTRRSFDTLPSLTKKEALNLLKKPIEEITLESDYYKAAFHLAKYPGEESEKALIDFLVAESEAKPFQLARRKVIEVLAEISRERCIPIIVKFLESEDPYIVESTVIALNNLKYKDKDYIQTVINLLDKPYQNKRLLIQTIARFGSPKDIESIKPFLLSIEDSPFIRSAAISAIIRLGGSSIYSDELKLNLSHSNQMQRQMAVEDIINSRQASLLPFVLRCPVSPFFRIRAIEELWQFKNQRDKDSEIISAIDSLLLDRIEELDLTCQYESNSSIESLIDELFSTDFNRCYAALKLIKVHDNRQVWSKIIACLDQFKKDYGAIYFLLLFLFNSTYNLGYSEKEKIIEFIRYCLSKGWSDFMKFRPIAIYNLILIKPYELFEKGDEWLDHKKTPYWLNRYATLKAIQDNNIQIQSHRNKALLLLEKAKNDQNSFVRVKAIQVISLF